MPEARGGLSGAKALTLAANARQRLHPSLQRGAAPIQDRQLALWLRPERPEPEKATHDFFDVCKILPEALFGVSVEEGMPASSLLSVLIC